MNQQVLRTLAPGATLGMLGAGQLGRMFALAAREAGYRIAVYGGGPESPCGQVSDVCFDRSFDDQQSLREFAAAVDVISYEYENIPLAAVEFLQTLVPVFPDSRLLRIAQHRLLEKRSLQEIGIPTAAFTEVRDADDLRRGLQQFGGQGILKTATMGYDGKGQVRINGDVDAEQMLQRFAGVELILEEIISFQLELSVVAAGFAGGQSRLFAPVVNHHVNHILDCSRTPDARLTPQVVEEAGKIATRILEHFGVIGVFCVEFFLTDNGRLLVNELAPRPHNSGHLTIEGCAASQFEQQYRAICGLPAGAVMAARPAVMLNLLGDHLVHATPERWQQVFAMTDLHVHLYGKLELRSGRKMGHLTALADDVDEAESIARSARKVLGWDGE